MNLRTFAQRILADPAYRQSLIDRAKAGTLPPDVEELIWSIADLRVPLDRPVPSRPPKPTLAFQAPRISDDERQERLSAAVLCGDVEAVVGFQKQEES